MKHLTIATACFAALAPFGADALTLTTGTGDGSVTVGVDGFGSFGSSVGGAGTSDAIYDPVGAIQSAGTVFESAVAFSFANVRPYLTTGSLAGPANQAFDLSIVSANSTEVVSTFTLGSLNVQLVQSVSETLDDGVQVGSILNQVYSITNTASVTNSFDVVRYVDGDLGFDGTISDGGGRIFNNGSEILFETDGASADDATTTFLGVTGIGGTIPSGNRFQISSYSALRSNIAAGLPLADFIQNDTDGDGFIDSAFDVTLGLRNVFSLGAGTTQTYTTQTLFGNSVPPAPGSLESLPLLPDNINTEGAFEFIINADDINEGEIIFIDPVIATGYTYSVVGAEFSAVQAPSFAAVADVDGYVLNVGGAQYALASGQLIQFADLGLSGITGFSITGIDEALMIDPGNAAAFVTGIALTNFNAGTLTVTQAPIETDTDANNPSAVPLPASAVLLLGGVFGLGAMRRRKRAA